MVGMARANLVLTKNRAQKVHEPTPERGRGTDGSSHTSP
jgi:hypothetical protein